MGKISSETQGVTTNHFSHSHPLKLINHDHHQQQPTNYYYFPSSCAACNLHPSGLIYSCTTCPFFLHKTCFRMPNKITHPSHNPHPLTLLATPLYPDGLFNCDACGEHGSGFSYHCKPCGFDLHILCAVKPLSLTHAFHPHNLHLTFQSPYGLTPFCCDICKINGSNHWLYRCHGCGFDAHLKCASSPIHTTSAPYNQMQQNTDYLRNSAATGIPVASFGPQVGAASNELVIQAILEMARNNNAITQAYLASATRGGSMGGSQQLMQLISGLNGAGR